MSYGSNHPGLALPKPKPRVLEKAERAKTKARDEAAIRNAVRHRDQWQCRICGRFGMEVHHVRYRSRGGSSSDMANLVTLCRTHHREVHAKIWRPEVRRGRIVFLHEP